MFQLWAKEGDSSPKSPPLDRPLDSHAIITTHLWSVLSEQEVIPYYFQLHLHHWKRGHVHSKAMGMEPKSSNNMIESKYHAVCNQYS